MELSVLGINHRSAPVEVREKLSLSEDKVLDLLRTIRQEDLFEEALILSTCNRTELYTVGEFDHSGLKHFYRHFALSTGVSETFQDLGGYDFSGVQAARHLFRVTASLDSQMVGEDEILGQVRRAYRQALEGRTAKFLMHKLMHRAFRVGKRVRTETRLNQGACNVPQAAVSLAQKILGSLTGKKAAILGAGAMGASATRALLSAGVEEVILLNRTLSRAKRLAHALLQEYAKPAEPHRESCNLKESLSDAKRLESPLVQAESLEHLSKAIKSVDLLICATSAREFVLTLDKFRQSLKGRSLLILDLGVPRNVDPEISQLAGIQVQNMDDLNAMVADNLNRRKLAIPEAEAIVEEELKDWSAWLDSLQVTRSITLLKGFMDRLLEAEIKRRSGKISEEELVRLRRFGQSLCNKIQHKPFAFLKAYSAEESSGALLEALDLIHRMFDLDEEEESRT